MSGNQQSGSELDAKMRARCKELLIFPALFSAFAYCLVAYLAGVMLPRMAQSSDGTGVMLPVNATAMLKLGPLLWNPLSFLLTALVIIGGLKLVTHRLSERGWPVGMARYAGAAMIIGVVVAVGFVLWTVLSVMFSITGQIGAQRQ